MERKEVGKTNKAALQGKAGGEEGHPPILV